MNMSRPTTNPSRILLAAFALLLLTVTASSAVTPQEKKKSREGTALLYGTVFTEEGFALRGAAVRVRRKDAKKPKWKTATNSRGEFAVRLPRASGDYEVTVAAKGYENATREFTVTLEEEFNFYFRLKHPPKDKTEADREKKVQ